MQHGSPAQDRTAAAGLAFSHPRLQGAVLLDVQEVRVPDRHQQGTWRAQVDCRLYTYCTGYVTWTDRCKCQLYMTGHEPIAKVMVVQGLVMLSDRRFLTSFQESGWQPHDVEHYIPSLAGRCQWCRHI
jgi:hypothetical protein